MGYIYVLSNPCMPGIVKIGYTDLTPNQRAFDLFTTGVPTEFIVEYEVDVNIYAKKIEKIIFDELKDVRIPRRDVNNKSKREFFEISIEHAIEAIDYCIRGFIFNKSVSLSCHKEKILERYNIVMPQISSEIIKTKTQKAHDEFIESYEKIASFPFSGDKIDFKIPLNINDLYFLEYIVTRFGVAVANSEHRDTLTERFWDD